MKKHHNFSFLTIFLISAALFAQSKSSSKLFSNLDVLAGSSQETQFRGVDQTDFMNEQWDGGMGTWTHFDENATPPMWHPDSWNAFGGSGDSWWMADPSLGNEGGYNNSWYQVLDTDPFGLTGTSPQLTFDMRVSVETPGGEPTGYDGWDGVNVRISTDGGASWIVLTNPTPAYTATSLYSFGFEHGEGTGIPGWAGEITAWTPVVFDLSAYTGQTVMIRFAFASDPGYSTGDGAPALFGWQVDNINVLDGATVLFENYGETAGMTASNNVPSGADLWHVEAADGATTPPFASCNNSSGTYEPSMNNSLVSDYVYLNPLAASVYMDFAIRGTYADDDVFPNVDYFGAYVQVNGESAWRYVSNITQDPAGFNYVYSSAPDVWGLFSATYSVGLIDLTPLIGNEVRVKFTFESDDDAPQGTGIQVDDIVIWTPDEVPVELTSFTAVQDGRNVNINWTTATETNNFGFEIERKTGDSDWMTLAFKDGKGTTAEKANYSYVDDITGINSDNISYRLKQIDFDGSYEYSSVVELTSVAPVKYELYQNYPNPFNPTTEIRFDIPESEFVSLNVYNALGQQVAQVVNEMKEAGSYKINFDASNLSAGVYIYQLNSGNFTSTKKMMLIK